MGADIHLVLEKRYSYEFPIGPKWVGINDFDSITVCDPISPVEGAIRPTRDAGPRGAYLFWNARERNYERFAMLAGVRGTGPDPKGMPTDASDLALMRMLQWDSDGHSHTWYSLTEATDIFFRSQWEPHKLLEKILNSDVWMPDHMKVQAVTSKLTAGSHAHPLLMHYYFGIDPRDDDFDAEQYRLVMWFDN